MAVIYQTDTRSGITYAYEAEYHWDKKKKQSRSVRKLIGRVDKETGEIVPTDGRMKRNKDVQSDMPVKRGPVPAACSTRSSYGATYLFDAIGDKLGITEDLKSCFPSIYKQLLSITYYLMLEDNNPLSRFEKWGSIHRHPYGKDISSQRSSELFMGISESIFNYFYLITSCSISCIMDFASLSILMFIRIYHPLSFQA